jgi:hypothetical protein
LSRRKKLIYFASAISLFCIVAVPAFSMQPVNAKVFSLLAPLPPDDEARVAAQKRVDAGLTSSAKVIGDLTNLRNASANRLQTLNTKDNNRETPKDASSEKESAQALHRLDTQALQMLNGAQSSPGLVPIRRKLIRTRQALQSSAPGSVEAATVALDKSCSALNAKLAAWRDLDAHAVPATTNIIAKSSLAALPTATVMSIMTVPQEKATTDACAP